MEISFSNPGYLWLLLGVPLLIIAYIYNIKYKKRAALKFSNFEAISRVFETELLPHGTFQIIISLFVYTLLVLAATGTSIWYIGQSSEISYVLALDSSISMTAEDYKPSRLEAAKEAAITFVEELPVNTKVGVVSFSGASFVDERLSDSHFKIISTIEGINIREIGGTNLGEAIISSVNLLSVIEEPKSIILLTDGQDTVGMGVEEGIKYAKKNHIIVHTIGIGTEEGGVFGGIDVRSQLDEEILKIIAQETNGMYFRAEDKDQLKQAYSDISQSAMQKIEIKLSLLFLLSIIILLLFNWIMSFTKYCDLP